MQQIKGYHAHVYFDVNSIDQARGFWMGAIRPLDLSIF